MTNPLEQIRELVNDWQKSRNFSGGDLAHSILAILDASQGYVCVPVAVDEIDFMTFYTSGGKSRVHDYKRHGNIVTEHEEYARGWNAHCVFSASKLSASKETNRE